MQMSKVRRKRFSNIFSLLVFVGVLGPKAIGATTLSCSVTVGGRLVIQERIEFASGERRKWFDQKDLAIFLTNKGRSEFELELFSASHEARLYSLGLIKGEGDYLGVSLGDRDSLVEARCDWPE